MSDALHAFPFPQPTSPSGESTAGRGQTTRRGGRGPGGGRAPSSRSWSGAGGSSGWRRRIGSAGNGRHSGVPGGRVAQIWDGGGAFGGARVSENGGRGLPGGHSGTSGSGSGASELVWRGGPAGSVRVGGGSFAWGGCGSVAVCGIGPRRGTSRASQEASVGTEGPPVVPPCTGGGESPTLHGSAA